MEARQNGVTPALPARTAENHAALPATVSLAPQPGSLPNGWAPTAPTNGASNFSINPSNGTEAHATLAVVAPSTGSQPFGREQRNMVGGASFTDLRRGVIDRMISAGGWVINDRQREIGGRRVFEVIAQTPAADGKPEQVWNFYFTEVNGRVYSLTTRSAGTNERIAADAEKFLGSFTPGENSQNRQK